MAQFSVVNGQVINPSGNVFIAKGMNVELGQTSAADLIAKFPGINAIRVPTSFNTDPARIQALIDDMTSHGIVTLIEDHTSSGATPESGYNNVVTGQDLTNELNWYKTIAANNVNNPLVQFGTANEPDNLSNLQSIPDQEKAIYDAIRSTGSHAMIAMEELGGGYSIGATANSPATYAGMTNVMWDFHYYGGESNGNTDPAVLKAALDKHVAESQATKSADGVMPVMVGEYGPSSLGSGLDPNGTQAVQTVLDSGLSSYAWEYNAGADNLVAADGSGNRTAFGNQVAQYFASGSTPTPTPAPTPSPTPTPTPTPSPTPTPTPSPFQSDYITPGKGSFTDGAGNVYKIDASGVANENGNALADGANTGAMQYSNARVYGQDATSHNWYTWNQTTWTPASAPPAPAPTPTPVPTPTPTPIPASIATDTLMLTMSEDAWQGDAQAVITVDGKPIGGAVTVTALHNQGKTQAVTLAGQWGPGAHDIGVQFINDAWGGTAATDRNLYVKGVTLDGQASAAPPMALYSNGTAHFATAASPLVLQLSEDAYQGDAQFAVAVDGKMLGGAQAVTALYSKGAVQNFAFGYTMAAGPHDVAVSFLNDAYGGSAATDRNLHVNAVDVNGAAMPGTAATLFNTSTQHFSVVVAAHL